MLSSIKNKQNKTLYVIDMRHDICSDSEYVVKCSWEEALKVAGKYWESYDGIFDITKKQPFLPGEGYDEKDTHIVMKKNNCLYISERPYITIQKAV